MKDVSPEGSGPRAMPAQKTAQDLLPGAWGSVTLVGAGPGDAELLTLKAARVLASAQLVLYDHLVSDAVLAHIAPGTRCHWPLHARRCGAGLLAGHSAPTKLNLL